MVIQVNNLSKKYGSFVALDNFSLSAEQGDVIGIIGPNGAGKTTFFNILLSLTSASNGQVTFFDNKPYEKIKDTVGVILEEYGFYPFLSGWDNLKIAANNKNCGKEDMIKALEIMELYDKKDIEVKKYSFGMTKRLSIACAILNDPSILVFDEPTNGLDSLGIRAIRNLIKELSAKGKTILLANHILSEIEKVCTKVVFLKKGKIVKDIPVKDIRNANCMELMTDNLEHLKRSLLSIPDLTILDTDYDSIVVTTEKKHEVLKRINEIDNSLIKEVRERSVSLEDLFNKYTNE